MQNIRADLSKYGSARDKSDTWDQLNTLNICPGMLVVNLSKIKTVARWENSGHTLEETVICYHQLIDAKTICDSFRNKRWDQLNHDSELNHQRASAKKL